MLGLGLEFIGFIGFIGFRAWGIRAVVLGLGSRVGDSKDKGPTGALGH